MKLLIQYFSKIKFKKVILWCYLIWYLVIVYFYFDPSLKLWINAIGISAVIGTGLMLSVSSHHNSKKKAPWQTFRLYAMPFCVSSFSALIKGQGFIIVVSSKFYENIVAIGCCSLFLFIVGIIKLVNNKMV